MSYATIAIIYNPNSTGDSESLAKDLHAQLHKRMPDQKLELHATKRAGHAEEIAYSTASSSERPLIISSSGDGGYHEVVNGAMRAQREGKHPTLSLLPAGNANDHYKNLYSNINLLEAIELGSTTSIDLLRVTTTLDHAPFERYAHSYVGFGLTPSIGKELNKTNLSFMNEKLTVLRSLFRFKSVRLQVAKKVHRYDSIIFSNIDTMSKYLHVSRPSSVTDGKFEVTIFRRGTKIQLLATLLKASIRLIPEDVQTSTYSLRTVDKSLIQLDGEIYTLDKNTDVDISIEPRILTIVS